MGGYGERGSLWGFGGEKARVWDSRMLNGGTKCFWRDLSGGKGLGGR